LVTLPLKDLFKIQLYKKMYKNFIAVCLLFFSLPAAAQSKQVDSLLKLLDSEKADSNRLRIYNRIGNYYMNNNAGKAIQYFENAVAIAEKIKRPLAIANNNYSIGYCNLMKGDFDKSLESYLKSVRIYEELKDSLRLSNALMSIANVYSQNKNYKKTNDYFDKAQLLIEGLKDSIQLGFIFDSRGTLYDQRGLFDSAMLFLQKSHAIAVALKDNYSITTSLSNIGLTYKHQKKNTRALQCFDSVLAIFKKEQTPPDRFAAVYNNIGATHAQLSNYAIAKQNFTTSIDYAVQAGSPFISMENYRNLADMYGDSKNYEQQSIYLKKYYTTKDSLFTSDSKNQLTQLEADYNIEKKNIELVKKESDIEKQKSQRNIFIIIALGSVLLLGGLGFFYSRIKNKNKLLEQKNIQINKQKEELQTLNNVKDRLFSIISHDLRNPLITLRSYLTLSDNASITEDKKQQFKKQTIQAVTQTSDMLDNLLVWANLQIKNTSAAITPVDINECVLDVINEVQAQAQQKQITIHKNIEATTALGDNNILNIALRNLLTNAIKYSSEHQSVYINAVKKGNRILLSVKDDGIGMTAVQLNNLQSNQTENTKGTQGEKGSGLGIFLVKELLQKTNSELLIESEQDKGSNFTISLPGLQD
jgi:signal transduction histidine kinase